MELTQFLGYAASVMVAISLTMRDLVRLRVLNFVGCALFIFYGLAISAWPIVLTNSFIAVVNLYFLTKAYKAHIRHRPYP